MSPAETLDAARALDAVGVEDRGLVEAALEATLAKTVEARAALARHMGERWRAPSSRRGAGAAAPRGAGSAADPAAGGGRAGARDQGGGGGGSSSSASSSSSARSGSSAGSGGSGDPRSRSQDRARRRALARGRPTHDDAREDAGAGPGDRAARGARDGAAWGEGPAVDAAAVRADDLAADAAPHAASSPERASRSAGGGQDDPDGEGAADADRPQLRARRPWRSVGAASLGAERAGFAGPLALGPARSPAERKRRAAFEALLSEGPGGRHPRVRAAMWRLRAPAAPGRDAPPLAIDLEAALSAGEEARVLAAFERALAALGRALPHVGRRRGRAGRRGALSPQRTARRALATGGAPFVLVRRARRPRPLSLWALVDVSWSVERVAGLFLRLAARLAGRFRDARVHVFVDRPLEATALLRPLARRARAPAGRDLEALLADLPGLHLGARSDYGEALFAYAHGPAARLGRDAVLVIVGDARTNALDPQAWCLADLSARAARVLWWVPEPIARWGSGDSALAAYAPYCDALYETATAEGLLRAARDLAR